MSDGLDALTRKYRTLRALRDARAQGGDVAPADVLRALAAEFPGALRELDVLDGDTLTARAEGTARALEDPARVEPWMHWMVAFHRTLAAALALRRAMGTRRAVTASRMAALVARATEVAHHPMDEAFVRAVARPEGGRLVGAVYAQLAARFAVDEGTLRGVLVPDGRRAG